MLERRGALVQDGWWRTWGPGWDPRGHHSALLRVYLRPADRAAGPLVTRATHALAGTDVWLLKVAADAETLARPDAAVAYLGGPERERDRDRLVAAVTGTTAGAPPPLTEPLADGIGWAEDPATGASFGEERCRAIASAHSKRAPGTPWLDAVAHEFRCRGIDPAHPHLSTRVAEVAG